MIGRQPGAVRQPQLVGPFDMAARQRQRLLQGRPRAGERRRRQLGQARRLLFEEVANMREETARLAVRLLRTEQ